MTEESCSVRPGYQWSDCEPMEKGQDFVTAHRGARTAKGALGIIPACLAMDLVLGHCPHQLSTQ